MGALTGLLMIAVLSACGNAATNPQESAHAGDHGAQHEVDGSDSKEAPAEASHSGEHGGHGDSAEPPTSGKLKAAFTFPTGAPQSGEETEVTIEIANERGERITDFEVSHEKLLHLIIVDHDLKYFNHIHPDRRADGTFSIRTTFPAGGDYKLFADVVPTGGSGITLSQWVSVAGAKGEHAEVAVDPALRKIVDGKEIALSLSSLRANEESILTFDIRDAVSKEGVVDLQPYLGAVGHVVILSADAEQYLHVHPLDEAATGPTAQFATSFPGAGLYKIWGQFRHENEVFTVSYVVEAE